MVSTLILPVSRSVSGASTAGDSFHTPSSPLSFAGLEHFDSAQQDDEENVTITRPVAKGQPEEERRESEDLHMLAISTHMTELSYAISDIQTRIFEIQELRHKSQSTEDASATTATIDQSLIALNGKLESVEQGIKSIDATLAPLLQNAATPTIPSSIPADRNGQHDTNETAVILRKHAALVAEWTTVKEESVVLGEELKEDKWLTVFRTVTDQADGMMSSLEKAVKRCQDFIWQVHRDDSLHRSTTSLRTQDSENHTSPTLDRFNELMDSYEAKKKHYMPATSKVLSIIDKGVRDRVTKNGETLRRHAESSQRWKSLRERIARTDSELESVRKILLSGETTPSEADSSTSGRYSMKNGYLATPPSSGKNRAQSSSEASGTMSPFRKFAKKLTSSASKVTTPPHAMKKLIISRTPSSEPHPALRKQRSTGFGSMRASEPPTPNTPDRPLHKYSHSMTPDSSPQTSRIRAATPSKGRPSLGNKQPWNSSTKVEPGERVGTIRGTPPRRPPSSFSNYGSTGSEYPPIPYLEGTPQKRSVSRASNVSSRPFSPAMSSSMSLSTNQSSTGYQPFRPPSRAQTPSRGYNVPVPITPRARPKTPSHIPMPSKQLHFPTTPSGRSVSTGAADSPPSRRAFSPAFSTSSGDITSSGFFQPPPRPPSRSMIPVPSLSLSGPSRPSSAMSDYGQNSHIPRAQTPSRQTPGFPGTTGRSAGRLSLGFAKAPPSSFKESQSPSSRAPSRSGSRAGAYTPLMDNLPLHEYVPSNPKDPLDVEVAEVVNNIVHGLLVERVDPPLRKIPKEGEEIKAQYAFSNSLSRKVITCRLTTMTRPGKNSSGETTTKKVMVRVGGGWQDLSHYILNRQAGM